MVHEDNLSSVLSEFARTMVTDFPIQAILDHLVERIVDVLPVSAAGVTLISANMAPHYIAASDSSALRFERLQTEVGEGPCLTAYTTGESVSVPDLAVDDRFPEFGPLAVRAGLAAVWTFPLRHGQGRLGALDLYRDEPGGLAEHDMRAAQTLADVVAAYLINAQTREDARVTSDRFHHSALHDALTGLPNRLLLQQRLEHAGQRAQRSHTLAAVLFADLDRFKQVNDTHGHQVGDQLLLAVAHRLSRLVRPGDTLARVSGDEFVFLCEDLHDLADAELLARRIADAFVPPFSCDDVEVEMTASVGMAFAGRGEAITPQLVVDADIAMYQAKRKGGGGHQVIDLREVRAGSDRDHLEADLRAAFARRELSVAYQPVVGARDGRVRGVEALLRWDHPQRGPVSPTTMIQIAEQSELIVEIGAWVLEQACHDRSHWLRLHPEHPLDVAVNVSGGQLLYGDFQETVVSVLARTGVDPTALVLEVTENIFIEDSAHVIEVLAALKRLGVRLALDDFGTGYSSLNYLRRLPVDIVKIDQSFIGDIGQHEAGAAIVSAITHLAHVLGMSVTAEGVETSDQQAGLCDVGCEMAQGFYFSPPVPAAAITDLLASDGPRAVRLPLDDVLPLVSSVAL